MLASVVMKRQTLLSKVLLREELQMIPLLLAISHQSPDDTQFGIRVGLGHQQQLISSSAEYVACRSLESLAMRKEF